MRKSPIQFQGFDVADEALSGLYSEPWPFAFVLEESANRTVR